MSYTCRRIELGRHGSVPETMVNWEGSPIPTPYAYFRTTSLVAYAELCTPDNLGDAAWTEIVNCARNAGIAAGIATIVAARKPLCLRSNRLLKAAYLENLAKLQSKSKCP
jgi:hypothetical protein